MPLIGVTPQHGQVVGLGAAAREHDVTGVDPEHTGERIAGVVDQRPRLPSGAVRPAGVGRTELDGLRVGRPRHVAPGRRRRMIEVDATLLNRSFGH